MIERGRGMTDNEMIELVTALSGESSSTLVSAFISMAGDAIKNRAFPFASDTELSTLSVPVRYQNLQVEIAVYLLDKRGAEGETVHNENGINRSYENGSIPGSMLKQVVPFCGVPTVPFTSADDSDDSDDDSGSGDEK